MRADLHLHSVWSDGLHTPAELAAFAKRAGLGMFSVTDHDSMGGSDEGAEAARRCGLRFVRGWEVSAYRGNSKVHVLGYGCRMDEAYFAFREERFRDAIVRARACMKLANDFCGLDVTMDEIEAYHVQKEAPLHTMHIVRAFAKRLAREEGELYNEVFAYGRPAFVGIGRPTPEEAVEVIRKTGGMSVLAHPGRIFDFTDEEFRLFHSTEDPDVRSRLLALNAARRDALMDSLVSCGLDGIECYYTTHTAVETEYFLAYARRYGLAVTGGSDFHSEDGRHAVGLPVFEPDEGLVGRLLGFDGSI